METNHNSGSKCTRCGKTRVVLKTFKKTINNSEVLYRLTGCADPECQKIVNQQLKKEKKKREDIKKEQVKREEQRKENSRKRIKN